MFVGSIPSTHNKTFSGFSFCLLFFLSSPRTNPCSMVSGELVVEGESSVRASGRQRMWLAGSRAEHTGSWLTKDGTTQPLHSQGVLVSLAIVKSHHRPSGLNNRHLFLTVLGAEKCKVKVKVDSGPEASSWPCREQTLHCLPTWQKQRERASSLAPLPKGTLTHQGAPL